MSQGGGRRRSASEPGPLIFARRINGASMEEIARFSADLLAMLQPAQDGPVALAVSGGPDSMAMLWLARAALPGKVIAATVDHRLRDAGASEAASVARWCEAADVPHTTLTIGTPRGASGNLHSWARAERYERLRHWCHEAGGMALCTAHHADDQAETFLMRAARGAGVTGLSAIREAQNYQFFVNVGAPHRAPDGSGFEIPIGGLATVRLLRPLLTWRRAELRALAERERLPFTDDPSNVDLRFQRARIRAWLAQAPWIDAAQMARSARQLAAVNDDLTALSNWLWDQRAEWPSPEEVAVDVADLPREVRRRLVRIGLVSIDALEQDFRVIEDHWGATNLEPLLDALEAGRQASQGDVLAFAKGTRWHFRPAPPRRR